MRKIPDFDASIKRCRCKKRSSTNIQRTLLDTVNKLKVCTYDRSISAKQILRRHTINNDMAIQSSCSQIWHIFIWFVSQVSWSVLRIKFEPLNDYELIVWRWGNVSVGKGYFGEVLFGIGLFFIWDHNARVLWRKIFRAKPINIIGNWWVNIAKLVVKLAFFAHIKIQEKNCFFTSQNRYFILQRLDHLSMLFQSYLDYLILIFLIWIILARKCLFLNNLVTFFRCIWFQ